MTDCPTQCFPELRYSQQIVLSLFDHWLHILDRGRLRADMTGETVGWESAFATLEREAMGVPAAVLCTGCFLCQTEATTYLHHKRPSKGNMSTDVSMLAFPGCWQRSTISLV